MVEVKALQAQVRHLVDDLRVQVGVDDGLRAELRKEYDEAQRAGRFGGTFEVWLDDVLDRAAVAWVLGCVFVRFCEDNDLVNGLWIGGPEPHAPVELAIRHRQAHIMANPRHNDRDWLREAFSYLRGLPATDKIFDEHNPVWRFDISGEAAEVLCDFFRRGAGLASLRREAMNTRLLGDLYQDLSAHARSTYALLQTPEFVESFILDRAFVPALDEFGLAAMRVIDPACGSGHFLLGAFHRLFKLWSDREPATNPRDLAERALGQVTGVDLNGAAVAIARFRLLIAALQACGMSSLEQAPHFKVRVATGDSLLPWGDYKAVEEANLFEVFEGRPMFAYSHEDEHLLKEYLAPGQYTVVVGNPPYITVKDPAQNELYRDNYSACSGKYSLTVPFAQRFFQLARRGDSSGDGAGWVAQITANSFMKREFGKKLINQHFRHDVELAEIIDTSGAYIPGHGTPTVILIGVNRPVSSRYSGEIRAVLGVRGEPTQPTDPANGHVWSAILDQIDRPGSASQWLTVENTDRDSWKSYPWSLSGGGASQLLAEMESGSIGVLSEKTSSSGFVVVSAEDDAFFLTDAASRRVRLESVLPMVSGDVVRDFVVVPHITCVFPYDGDLNASDLTDVPRIARLLWPNRRVMQRRKRFGRYIEDIPALRWYEFGELYREKLRAPRTIVFAFVATHNHFVLDRGGKVFNRSAPVIKLAEGASEDEHLRLLGVLNSSTACFWLKQVCHDKGIRGQGGGFTSDDWEHFYEFTGTKLEQFPLPAAYPLEVSRTLDGLAQRLAAVSPAAVAGSGVPTRARLKEAKHEWHDIRAQMIAWQEELDWQVYRLYGLINDDLTTPEPPGLALGQRAFEIALAREGAETQWFERHGSTPITELPGDWPADYRALVEKRLAVIASDRHIGLIELPECKRRWATEGWDALQAAALRDWLLDRLEAPELWGGAPIPLSVAQLADRVRHDEDFREALDLWVGHDQHDLTRSVGELVADQHVPFLPSQRYKPSGLRNRALWERTWAQQRREDAGEEVTPDLPPKYKSADFIKASFWRHRGKLDVPKERFISYPGAGQDGDPTLLLGWAGWDQVDQARALATVYLDRKTRAAWPADRLLPLLAGLVELEPWLHQWFSGPQPGFPGSPATFFTGLIDTELSGQGADRATLHRIRGVEAPA